MIRYLKEDEKSISRSLWEEVFPEDVGGFSEYYYSERAGGHKVLAAVEAEGVIAMLHRNPYTVAVKDREWKINYIGGVGTRASHRHQGYMSRLLERCFADMYEEGMGFTYLVPANPDIYDPFGFTYICDHARLMLDEAGREQLIGSSCEENSGDCEEAAEFAGDFLGARYDVHTVRDGAYYKKLCREVRSTGGDVVLYRKKDSGEVAGISAFYAPDGTEEREFICLPEYCREKGGPKPAVMGRIIHLEQFISVIRLREDAKVSEMELLLEVRDGRILKNNGIFRWHLDHSGSVLTRVEEAAGATPHLSLEIGEMTSWLFGYSMPEAILDCFSMVKQIQPLSGVFFDEIV